MLRKQLELKAEIMNVDDGSQSILKLEKRLSKVTFKKPAFQTVDEEKSSNTYFPSS
jgi:hypothetical protein